MPILGRIGRSSGETGQLWSDLGIRVHTRDRSSSRSAQERAGSRRAPASTNIGAGKNILSDVSTELTNDVWKRRPIRAGDPCAALLRWSITPWVAAMHGRPPRGGGVLFPTVLGTVLRPICTNSHGDTMGCGPGTLWAAAIQWVTRSLGNRWHPMHEERSRPLGDAQVMVVHHAMCRGEACARTQSQKSLTL